MEEIKKIIEANDIAAVVVLHDPIFSEFFIKIDPSYSAAKFTPTRDSVHFKLASAHYGNDKAKRDEFAKNTANMLHHLERNVGGIALTLIKINEDFEKRVDVEHLGGDGHSSIQEQNN